MKLKFLLFFVVIAGQHFFRATNAQDENVLLRTPGLYKIVEKPGFSIPGKQVPSKYGYRTIAGLSLATQCFYECRIDSNCKSFTHNDVSGSCSLNSKTYTEVGTEGASDGVTCYDRAAFDIPKDALGICADDPCRNQATCLDKYDETTGNKDYECVCPDGWTGQTCEIQAGTPTWEEWKPWSQCSVSCGAGYQERNRQCIDSLSKKERSEQECWGSSIEIQLCTPKPCPVWENWSAWSDCSTNRTCGQGIKTRTRSCRNGGVIDKDLGCFGLPKDEAPCESPTCHTMVVLAGSPNYGEGRVRVFNDLDNTWGQVCGAGLDKKAADVICHQVGLPKAFKVVSDDSFGTSTDPYFVGNLQCEGTEPSIQRCQHGGWSKDISCPTGPAKVRCQVNGAWSCWSGWSSCSVTCAEGFEKRTRSCNDPPPLREGAACSGEDMEKRTCNPGQCPVDGEWYPWMDWSSCTASCGGGTQNRTRACKQPLHGGLLCTGSASEGQKCNDHPCPVHCTWKTWDAWGACNATCGTGHKMRTRTWNEQLHGGKPCEGENFELTTCNDNHCPVNGQWKEWGPWGSCDVKCGKGTRRRLRSCDPPQHGGSDHCYGLKEDTDTCQLLPCRAKSCSELRASGQTEDVTTKIDPDGEKGQHDPILAHCNMTAQGGVGVTEIWHDFQSDTHFDKFPSGHEIFRKLLYEDHAAQAQLIQLVDNSASCRQFISWKCKGSGFRDASKKLVTYWVNRNNQVSSYWGGGPTDAPFGCACGKSGSCDAKVVTCNCDIGDQVWREDSGYITKVDDLPVTKFVVGNTGDGKEGYIKVGPLECWGSKP